MRKRLFAFALALVLVSGTLIMSASAATPRMTIVSPGLRFTGTTAHCDVSVTSDKSTDEITATIKLWNGSSCVATWYDIAYGTLSFYATRTVNLNTTYVLTVDATVNGVSYPTASVERTS